MGTGGPSRARGPPDPVPDFRIKKKWRR